MVSRADELYMSSNFYCTYTNIDAILVLLVVGGVRGVVGGCGQGVWWEGGKGCGGVRGVVGRWG